MLVVEVPKPFPYKSQKAIPWDYNCNYTYQTVVNNLTSIGAITQSERCYAPDMAENVTLEKLLLPTNEEQPSREKERLSKKKRKKIRKLLKVQASLLLRRKQVNF